ncbi:MAG TPA: molybdopterin-guanine dinucleotide biosynthesis protein MobB [bacterium]|nr:molybdopterin-guanine dinucleotide biosynthesis protein MobB [bacterium]
MELARALDLLLAEASSLPTERVTVRNACGRIASDDIAAPAPVPHFRRAAMDGYVCHDDDLRHASPEHPVLLRVTGAVTMGVPPGPGPGRGEAWTITTGGPIPAHGDRVVPFEAVRATTAMVRIDHPVTGHRNIAAPGEDIRAGARLVIAGDVITPGAAAALAASGLSEVGVRRRLKVGIVATGTELVESPADPRLLPPGPIVNSNSIALHGMLTDLGCAVEYLGIVPDDREALRESFAAASSSYDLVISTGGVSVGRHDAVHRTWLDAGARRVVGRIDLKPGGPFFAARLDDRWVIGLSGTPVACLAAFHLLARPVVLRLQGRRHTVRPLRMATLATPVVRATDRQRALWGKAYETGGGEFEIALLDGANVGNYASVLDANALALIAPGTPPLPAASRVPALMLDREETSDRLVVPSPERAPAIVGVVGESGGGKTTVLSGVVRRLTACGIKTAAVKHAPHGFVVDRPGSDSARLTEAGALVVAIAGPKETTLRIATAVEEPDRIAHLAVNVCRAAWGTLPDCILLEGFQHQNRPVIQVGPQKPGIPPGEVWASVPAVTELDERQLDAEVQRVADIVKEHLERGPAGAPESR